MYSIMGKFKDADRLVFYLDFMEKLPLNAVKFNLTKLTTKRSSCHSSGSQCFLDVSVGAVQPIIVACLSMV